MLNVSDTLVHLNWIMQNVQALYIWLKTVESEAQYALCLPHTESCIFHNCNLYKGFQVLTRCSGLVSPDTKRGT